MDFVGARVLDGVNFALDAGEVVAIAGKNGAGKTTLVRCLAADLPPSAGRIRFEGRSVSEANSRPGGDVAVVWQERALCDNLDIAANLLLGAEGGGLLLSEIETHHAARRILDRLAIPLPDTTKLAGQLSGGQRQLLAIAQAMRGRPRLLILDEPTATLGGEESAQVESLIAGLAAEGTTILLVSHDVEQMFRLAHRMLVLRRGRLVADLPVAGVHPDEVEALLSGQPLDATPRRQLSRLQTLVDRLAAADPTSGLSLILTSLSAALGAQAACVHSFDSDLLRLAASAGRLPMSLAQAPELAVPPGADPRAVADVVARTLQSGRLVPSRAAIPITGGAALLGVLTVLRPGGAGFSSDEMDLITLYAGHAAAALERERLLAELTSRNTTLETLRRLLEALAGPGPVPTGLQQGLQALLAGLGAEALLIASRHEHEGIRVRAQVPPGQPEETATRLARELLTGLASDEPVVRAGDTYLGVRVPAPGPAVVLLARWPGTAMLDQQAVREDAVALLGQAAWSVGLALEREHAAAAQQEALALRRSRQLQRGFLSRLSHELRTPLTAIQGYASSLLAPDVTWDADTSHRFLSRIASESARLARLVSDLLDFSAIESGTLRLHPDWCDLRLVITAALGCLDPATAVLVQVDCPADLPTIWADHDRLEQVFLNLLENAVRHNPAGTSVRVSVELLERAQVEVRVIDDGRGLSSAGPAAPAQRGAPADGDSTRRSGLGLGIARGIVRAHGGVLRVGARGDGVSGTQVSVVLPAEESAEELAVEGLA